MLETGEATTTVSLLFSLLGDEDEGEGEGEGEDEGEGEGEGEQQRLGNNSGLCRVL